MVRKKIAMAVLALSALQADIASALGLGNVAVKSSLNQPLNAEIKLLDTGELDDTQIRVTLASPDDFQRAGVDRDYFLTNLRFSVELDKRGNGVIRVTTREAVVEPYLNFIVETRWPSGRLLREYAVLLDPPTFSATPAAPATGSGLATVQQRAQSQPAPSYSAPRQTSPAGTSAASASSRQQLVAQPAATGSDEYRVQHNDTLSSIAARFRPADDVNVQQTMVAIQQANPSAFIRGNINLVKSGYVLRIPSADAVRAISGDVAATTVRAHNEAWRSGGTPAEALAGPQLDARRPAASDDAGPQERERLSIATAGDSERQRAGDGASRSSAGDEALRNELMLAQEGLDSAQRENEELESRLDDMERQIATLQRLLALKDDQLAALQAAAGEAVAADTTDQAADGEPAESDEAAALVPPVVAPAEPEAADPQPGDATPPTSPTPSPQAAPKPAPAPAEVSLADDLLANAWIPLAGGAVLLLLLAALVVAQRRRAAAEREALAELEADEVVPVPIPAEEQLDLDDMVVSDDGISDVRATAEETAPAAVAEPVRQPVRAETGDAVAEADIYMAYGRYQQAVDLLRSAIEQEPARSDLRVKLLEVYLEMRERDAFRAEFRELQALGDEQAVAQVKEMLSSVDGVSGWLDGLGDTGGSSLAAAGFGGALAAAAHAQADDELIFDADHEDDKEQSEELLLDLDLDDLDQPQSGDEQELDFAGLQFESDAEEETPATASSDELDELNVEVAGSEASAEEPFLGLELSEEFEAVLSDEPASDLGETLQPDDALELNEQVDVGDEATPVTIEPTPAVERVESDLELEPGLTSDLDGSDEQSLDSTLDLGGELDLEGELDLDLSDLERDAESLNAAFGDASLDEIEPAVAPLADEPASLTTDDESSSWSFDGDILDSDTLATSETDAAEAEGETVGDDAAAIDAAFDEMMGALSDQPLATGDEPAALVEPGQAPETVPDFEVEGLGDLAGGDAQLDELESLSSFDDLERLGSAGDEQPSEDPLAALSDLDFDAELVSEAGEESDAALGEPFDLPADGGTAGSELDDLTDLAPYTPEVAAADADDEFDFLADADEVATKLDLARAYIDMGDTAGARDILDEVVMEGTDPQKEEAQSLLSRIA